MIISNNNFILIRIVNNNFLNNNFIFLKLLLNNFVNTQMDYNNILHFKTNRRSW